jgi:WD40 repeat protein
VRALAFSRDGAWLASGGEDSTVRLWSIPDGSLRQIREGHPAGIRALAFSPDGRWLISGDEAGELRRWSLQEEAEPQVLIPSGKKAVKALAFSEDGQALWAGWEDGEIRILRMPEGALRGQHRSRIEDPAALVLFPDQGRWIAARSDGELEVGEA